MIQKYLSITLASLTLYACGGGGTSDTLEGKKAELAQLKSDIGTTQQKIAALEKDIAQIDTAAGSKVRAKAVTIDTLNLSTFKHFVELQGTVDAKNSVLVTPKTGGVVNRMLVKEGDYVRQGQSIAKLDDSVLSESIQELNTQLELANTLYEKQKKLWDQKIGTELQYLQAKNAKESLERKLATLNTQIAQSTVTAPMSGVVDQVNLKVGEMAQPGMPVTRIVNLGNLKVVAKVADTYAGSVKKGDLVLIKFPDLNKNYTSRISFVSSTVDPLTRTFNIEANLPSERLLKPNMMAMLGINDATTAKALVIDENYIQNTENGQVVYVVTTEKGGKIAKGKAVKTGLSYNGQIEILDGLQAGDQLITMGYQDVSDGQPITY